MNPRFPDGFTFGAATSSYQIEGSHDVDGRAPSIWDTFSRRPGAILGGDTGDVASDHYRRFEQDLDVMAQLGLDAYRFSIAWPRIIPGGTGRVEPRGLDFYDRLVDGLLERSIAPMATLYHWDLPQAQEDRGGWAQREIVDAFAAYTTVVAERLGDRVANWATINEPWCISHLGYGKGTNAPGRSDPMALLRAAHHINLSHGAAVEVLRQQTAGRIGIAVNIQHLEPHTAADADVTERANLMANDIFLGPMFEGAYPERLFELIAGRGLGDPDWIQPGDEALYQPRVDWLAINYYTTEHVRARTADEGGNENMAWLFCEDLAFVDRGLPRTEMGWQVDPDGLRRLLGRLARRFPGLPFVVAENGAAYPDTVTDGAVHDAQRTAYVHDHLAAVLAAVDDGVPVEGYYVWSLLDNFEWSSGRARRFGITHVDYDTQDRVIKDSGHWYSHVLRTRELLPADSPAD